jgi:BirA family biotin operon repressor/biotin-[acetyl-CoA-carboxylase] ligase
LTARPGQLPEQAIDRLILEIFRERGGIVSGADLAGLLKVSRTAVWKHVSGLREQGYQILARRSSGYQLIDSPDILSPAAVTAGLQTNCLGQRVICVAETGSTNADASRLAEEGAPEGTVVIADSQKQGKGRLGRIWHSPPGSNLYCSLILRPRILPVAATQLTFLSAVAVARAIESVTPLKPSIKWPNDILLNERKVAGLLNEMSAETERVNYVILGIGVNLNICADQFPEDLRHPATSLFIEGGRKVSRLQFVRALLLALDELYGAYLRDGFEPVRAEWLNRCDMMGREVSVSGGSEQFAGTASGLDEGGALLVNRSDGILARVLAGDVRVI